MESKEPELLKTKCAICGKEFTGTSQSQLKYNLSVHVQTQHPDAKKVKK